MAENLLFLYDFYENCFPCDSNERIILSQSNHFGTLDENKFMQRYQLSKKVVLRLLDEVQ